MGTLRLGTLTPASLKLGTATVVAAYLGTSQVWPLTGGSATAGVLAGVGNRPTAALTGVITAPTTVVGTIGAASNRPTAALAGTVTAPAAAGVLTGVGQRPTAVINGTVTGVGSLPAVRSFTGGDNLQLAIGNSSADTFGNVTFAAVVRRSAEGTVINTVLAWQNSTPTKVGEVWLTAANAMTLGADSPINVDSTGPNVLIANDWVLLAWTKPTGNVAVRFHRVLIPAGTAIHQVGTFTTFSTWTAVGAGGRFQIGNDLNNTGWRGQIAGVGVFPTALSDVDVESLALNWDTWVTLGAKHLWVLDQAATTTAVTDSISGGNADQAALTGTTVVAGVAPIGWGVHAPSAPTLDSATPGNASATLSWTRGATGGAPITDYTVQYRTTAGPGAWNTFSHSASPVTAIAVTGLTNGTSYDFQVAAVTSFATSAYSNALSATPAVPVGVVFRSINPPPPTAGSGTMVVNKPTGVTTGDLLLIYCHSDDNNTMACTGFTAVGGGTYTGFGSATRRSHFLWKIATGSEPASYSVTGGGAGYNEAICLVYAGATGVGATGSTNGNFNSPALAVAVNGSMEVVALGFDNASSNGAAPAGWTRRLNGDGSYSTWIAERAANAGTTTSSNFTGAGDTTYGFGLISIILTP